MEIKLPKIVKRQDDGKINKRWLVLTVLAAIFIFFFLLTLGVAAFEIKYQDQFFPGSRVGKLSLEGLTVVQALDLVDQLTSKIKTDGIKITSKQDPRLELKVAASYSALSDPDLSREIFNFDDHGTVHQAFAVGHGKNFWDNLRAQSRLFFSGKKFSAQFTLDENSLRELLQQKFSSLEKPAQNSKPVITWQGNNYQIVFSENQDGVSINYPRAIDQFKSRLASLDSNPIELETAVQLATVKKAEAESKQYLVDELLKRPEPVLTFQEDSWKIGKRDLSGMLEFKKENGQATLTLNQESFSNWIDKKIAPTVNIEAQNAKLEIANGKIAEFSTHQEGQKINIEQTLSELTNNLSLGQNTTTLAVEKIQPKITTDSVNDLGIKEIIGVGKSNFAGSPTNRRHNIKNGAQKIHGILIKPDEEFSLINALGDVDATTGYLPELVIKENKTMPEYGGGLCQIGTTVFRAAMASGLPITERRNHSYNVAYYLEDGLPGTDATIYIPHPDVRFINDTGNYILVQRRIEGDNLYFEFWGAKDGRTATRTKPKVWGWVSPAPTKYVETLDLKPGQKKCTEVSHKGVNASFDYTVTYSSGEQKTTTFSSHYKPWQAVCLIGVEKLSTETTNGDNATASSTPVTP